MDEQEYEEYLRLVDGLTGAVDRAVEVLYRRHDELIEVHDDEEA